ncbi:MAG: helix-turn-helix transcriptional regulator, partial [Candidatus Aminicenantes bacterium]|nr:helix-turn-helix transcriptional regulator [Candidatus Aminicenantes bacterium]
RSQKKPDISINNFQNDIYDLIEKFNLTKREQEIFVLVIAGKTNKNIQDELFISLKTVKAHLYNIYRKLNVQNRLQLMNVIKTHSTDK